MSDVLTHERPGEVLVITPETAFLPIAWERIEQVAKMLCGAPGLVKEFEDMAVCRFVAYQAGRAKADPVAFATEVYFVPRKGGGLMVGYGAKLIHSLINQNAPIVGPLQFRYGYAGASGKDSQSPALKNVNNRFCEVIGMLRGASEPSRLTTPTVGQIKTKNSPTWFSDPDQQLSYFGVRNWARRFCPEVILGMYAREEIQEIAREVEPREHSLFEEDEPEDAVFDGIPAPEGQAQGGGDSRDPRDAPQNRPQSTQDGRSAPRGQSQPKASQDAPGEPEGPPQGQSEPDDMPATRAACESKRDAILLMGDAKAAVEAWSEFIKTKPWGRLKAYEPDEAKAILAAVTRRIEDLKAAE